MRHRKRTIKLGRTGEHRNMMLANMVCSLIHEKRVTTTLAKAKAARILADQMVTLGKDGSLGARRRALSKLRQRDRVSELFSDVAPSFEERRGGYTRILKLGKRSSDSSEMAILEWVEAGAPEPKKKKKSTAKSKPEPKAETPPPAEEETAAPEPEAAEEAVEEPEEAAEQASEEKADAAEAAEEESDDTKK